MVQAVAAPVGYARVRRPSDNVTRKVVQHGGEVHPAPPDDVKVGDPKGGEAKTRSATSRSAGGFFGTSTFIIVIFDLNQRIVGQSTCGYFEYLIIFAKHLIEFAKAGDALCAFRVWLSCRPFVILYLARTKNRQLEALKALLSWSEFRHRSSCHPLRSQ